MSDNNNFLTSIFEFIDDNVDDVNTNISNGTIAFVDKSFDNVPLPKLFNQISVDYPKIIDLKYYQINDIKRLFKKSVIQDKFDIYLSLVMHGLEYFKNNLTKTILDIPDIDILLARFQGNKLNEIGLNRNLTRERIRQIENSLVLEVRAYLETYLLSRYFNGYFENTVFFDFRDIFSFVKDNNVLDIIIYCIYSSKEYPFAIYSDDFLVYVNYKKIDLIDVVKNKIKLEKYFDYFDKYTQLNNSLVFEDNIIDFRIKIYLNYLHKHNYLIKGNLAYIHGECSINEIISMVIRDYYPNGIVLDEKGIKELSEFIEKLLNYPFKVNSALAKIDELNDELILWGKLKRIHIKNINISESKLKEILDCFKNIFDNVDYLLFDDAYKSMAEVLKDTPVTDKYKLYGLVKYYLNSDYYFKKMAVRKLEFKNQTLSDLVYDYIDKNDMCTKDDIVAELFISKTSLSSIYREKLDIICTDTYHTLIKKLNISDNTIVLIKKILELEVGNAFSHRDSIYEKHYKELNNNGIIDATMFYHLARYYFNNDYNFNSPYVQSLEYSEPVTVKNILLDAFKDNDYIVSIDSISQIACEKTASKEFSLVYNLRVCDIKVFRIDKETLTLNDKVIFEDIVKYMISNRLKDHFKKTNYVLTKDLKELAKGLFYNINGKKYVMNQYSLCSYIENNINEYNVFNSSALNNYFEASYAVSNYYNSYIDLVYFILKEHFKGETIDKGLVIKLLKQKNLFSSIPIVFINEGYLRIEDDSVIFLK